MHPAAFRDILAHEFIRGMCRYSPEGDTGAFYALCPKSTTVQHAWQRCTRCGSRRATVARRRVLGQVRERLATAEIAESRLRANCSRPIYVSAGLIVGDKIPTRIVVADSDARVRAALLSVLRLQSDEMDVRTCSDMEELASEILGFQPDVVLLDWELPGRPAAALLFALHGVKVKPKVIVLSVRPEAEAAALAAGADAFVSKGDWPERLLVALHRLSLN